MQFNESMYLLDSGGQAGHPEDGGCDGQGFIVEDSR